MEALAVTDLRWLHLLAGHTRYSRLVVTPHPAGESDTLPRHPATLQICQLRHCSHVGIVQQRSSHMDMTVVRQKRPGQTSRRDDGNMERLCCVPRQTEGRKFRMIRMFSCLMTRQLA